LYFGCEGTVIIIGGEDLQGHILNNSHERLNTKPRYHYYSSMRT
jgi:hypothetical protein